MEQQDQMKVNRGNYEVWMIDYFDGRLNAVEVAELMAFVEENHDLKKEFEAFENVTVYTEDIAYSSKSELRKDPIIATEKITEENYEEYFIAYYEDDLDKNQQDELLVFVASNPEIEKEFAFHNQLIIKTDSSVTFNDKRNLKRKPLIGIYWQISAAAAAILILFGLFTIFETNTSNISDRNSSMNRLSIKTIPVNLQQNPVPGLIEKRITFIKLPNLEKEVIVDEYLVLNQLSPQAPNISIINSNEYIRLAEKEATYYDISNSLALADEPKRKNAFGRIIQNLARRVSGNLPEKETEEINNDPTFVKALGTGITVFNTITGGDTELVKSYDQSGNLTGYYVEGETIGWRREIAPNSD